MSRDKQIEEMAKVIGDADQRCYEMDCDDCPLHDTELGLCKEKFNATELYEKGYRKASEVAREIFAEIEKKVKASLTIHLEEINKEHIKDTPLYDRHSGIIFALKVMDDFIAELKKKYTQGKEEIPPYVRMDAKALPAILNVKYTEEGK